MPKRFARYGNTIRSTRKSAWRIKSTSPQLDDERRLLVAEGRREGILFYSPKGPLTALELELLRAPGDSLCLLGLLPQTPVAVGDKWSPASWVGQMLTDTEAAAKSELNCTLESVTQGEAKVSFEGTVEGATTGSIGKVDLHGSYVYDLKTQRITRAELQQSEERSVGPVTPGIKVTAKSVVTITPAPAVSELSPEAAAAVPLEPPAALTQLYFRAPWNVELRHDRSWHVFQQTPQIAVLRLMDHGTFVAQCNMAPVRAANAGEHVPEQQFQNDIRTSLGKRLKTIEKAETIPTDDHRFLYRVTARRRGEQGPHHVDLLPVCRPERPAGLVCVRRGNGPPRAAGEPRPANAEEPAVSGIAQGAAARRPLIKRAFPI